MAVTTRSQNERLRVREVKPVTRAQKWQVNATRELALHLEEDYLGKCMAEDTLRTLSERNAAQTSRALHRRVSH